MITQRRFWLAAVTIMASGVLLLSGCSKPGTELTATEAKNFKGGPMPPAAQAEVARRMQEASRKAHQPVAQTPTVK